MILLTFVRPVMRSEMLLSSFNIKLKTGKEKEKNLIYDKKKLTMGRKIIVNSNKDNKVSNKICL